MRYPEITTDLPGPQASNLVQTDKTYVSPSYTRIYPLVVKEGQGIWVRDVDDNLCLDFTAGIAICATGHCHLSREIEYRIIGVVVEKKKRYR